MTEIVRPSRVNFLRKCLLSNPHSRNNLQRSIESEPASA
jgi:hypothetical protein